jgi:hypothetical protein
MLAALIEALKSGKMSIALGGKGGGALWGGKGVNTDPMKGNPDSKIKMTAQGKADAAAKQAKMSKEFAKYASMPGKPSKFLPNAMVKGVRNQNNSEMVQQYKGNPEQGVRAGTPYYEVYQQQRRSAESPVNKENIPAAYRRQVKEYFEAIKP